MTSTDQTERIYTYTSTATFISKKHQPCRFRTSNCPNECNHEKILYSFHIDSIDVTVNPDSTNAKYCTPVKQGDTHYIDDAELERQSLKDVSDSLVEGDHVELDWNHDYVTKNNCSSPEYPVVKLVKL